MLTIRNTGYAVLVILALLVLLKATWWWYVLVLFVFTILLFRGSYAVSSQFYMPVVCKAITTKKQIAISFDDGPLPQYTSEVLDVLQQHKISAVFFCIGHRIAGNEALLHRMHNEGHVVGNHSYCHHFWFDLFSSKKMQHDLQQFNIEVERVLHISPKLFRPPYGVTNPNLSKAVQLQQLDAIGWSVRSMDTVTTDVNKLYAKLVRSLQPGAVYLFHDTMQITPEVLPRFITTAKALGYEFVRPDILLNKNPYA